MAFCSNCGKELNEADTFCSNCGHKNKENKGETNNTYQQANNVYQPYAKTPTQTLADREQASAVVWLIIAILQGIIGICTMGGLSLLGNIIGIPLGWGGLFTMALAAYNGYGAYCSFQRVKRVQSRQRGIVREYDNMLVSSIIFIVLNAIFGAFIGIAGAIFDLFNRNYALNNAQYLED